MTPEELDRIRADIEATMPHVDLEKALKYRKEHFAIEHRIHARVQKLLQTDQKLQSLLRSHTAAHEDFSEATGNDEPSAWTVIDWADEMLYAKIPLGIEVQDGQVTEWEATGEPPDKPWWEEK